jgi:hypothetical protein
MGLLLEGLWGYHMTKALAENQLEIGWIVDNQYNDYACIDTEAEWNPETQSGELLRIEAKSMNLGADESKAHFDQLQKYIKPNDLLLVLTWNWEPNTTGTRVWPKVVDYFLEPAVEVAKLRDMLHIERGGTFVSANACPDACRPSLCQHDGEPLNAAGKRERLGGPTSRRVSANVSFAANFGGLFRMIGVTGKTSTEALANYRIENVVADRYVIFVNKNRGR